MVGISAIQPSSAAASAAELSVIQSQQAPASVAAATSQVISQAASATTQTKGHHHHHHHGGAAAMNAASQLLGMSPSDLTSALQSGQSLSSIAASQGVDQSSLVSAVSTALQGSNSGITPDQANQIAAKISSATPGTQNQPWGANAQAAGAWSAGTTQGAASTFSVGA